MSEFKISAADCVTVAIDLSVNNPTHTLHGEHTASERAYVAEILQQAAQKIGSGSWDDVLLHNGAQVGTITWGDNTHTAGAEPEPPEPAPGEPPATEAVAAKPAAKPAAATRR